MTDPSPKQPLKEAFLSFYAVLKAYDIRLRDIHVTNYELLLSKLTEEGTPWIDLQNKSVCYLDNETRTQFLIRDYPWLLEYNHNQDMDLEYFYSWRPFFETLVKKQGKFVGVGAEVGVLEGFLSDKVLKFLHPDHYYLVDPYKAYKDTTGELNFGQDVWDAICGMAQDRLKEYGSKVEFVRKSSVIAAKEFPDAWFDWVYIDADHKKNALIADIEAWLPKVKSGGLIGGHDYDEASVASAVGDICAKYGIVVSHKFNDWWFWKEEKMDKSH